MAEKRPRAKELRALPDADILGQLDGLRRELWEHRLKLKEGAQQKSHQIRAMKRQIARVFTVLRERRKQTVPSSGANPGT